MFVHKRRKRKVFGFFPSCQMAQHTYLSTKSQFVLLSPDESESAPDGTEVVGVRNSGRAIRGKVEQEEKEARPDEKTLKDVPKVERRKIFIIRNKIKSFRYYPHLYF